MALVFQYGSNTSTGRLNLADRLAGDAKDLGLVYTVAMFELDFDVWSSHNHCAAADIREGAGRAIWGVLYEIPDYLIESAKAGTRKSLDAIEGRKYQRGPISVLKSGAIRVEGKVITYTVRNPKPALPTSLEYASHILCGLREHGAPDEYVAYVKNRVITSNPALAADLERLCESLPGAARR